MYNEKKNIFKKKAVKKQRIVSRLSKDVEAMFLFKHFRVY